MSLTYNIYFEMSAAVFLIILFFFMKLQYNMQSNVNKEFQKLTLLVLAADILDVVTAITISYVFLVPAWVNILLNTLYFAADAAVGYQFMYYSVVYVFKNRKDSRLLKINNFLIVFYDILLFLNLFTGFIFSISAEEGYVHGSVYFAVYVVPFYLIICSGVILVSHFYKFQTRQRISITVYLILGISGPVLQMLFFPDVLLGLFTVTLGLVMMLFTMETPDYQKLVKTIQELQVTWQKESDARGIMKVAVSDSGIGMKPEEVERISESLPGLQAGKQNHLAGNGGSYRMNILVVDDDAMNLRMTEMVLAKKGYEVKKADSGQTALALLQSERIDLVLLDVEMPGMSGIETLDAIRARQELAQVPVLFLSASEDMESAVANGEYAVQGFIKKPILPPRLYEGVEAVRL